MGHIIFAHLCVSQCLVQWLALSDMRVPCLPLPWPSNLPFEPLQTVSSPLLLLLILSPIRLNQNPIVGLTYNLLPVQHHSFFLIRKKGLQGVRWLPIGTHSSGLGPEIRLQMWPTLKPGLLSHGIGATGWQWGLNCVELDVQVGAGWNYKHERIHGGKRVLGWSWEEGAFSQVHWDSGGVLCWFAKGGILRMLCSSSLTTATCPEALPYLGPAGRRWEPCHWRVPPVLWQTPFPSLILHPAAASLLFWGVYTHTFPVSSFF